MESTRKQKRRWLVEFAAVSLIPIVLLGVVLGQAIRSEVRDQKLAEARHEGELVSRLGFEQQLLAADLNRGLDEGQRQAIDQSLRAARADNEVLRLTIRNRNFDVIYSDDTTLVGKRDPSTPELASTLVGQVVTKVGNDPNGGQVLQVFVPIRDPGGASPVGVMETWLPYEPVAAAIKEDSGKLLLLLIGGLALTYLIILGVVAGSSQRLRRQAAEQEQQALCDALTGLPNRTLFRDTVQRAILAARRKKRMAAVMIMDLDRFKEINDTLGHHNGDLLLTRISSRMQGVLREDEAIARLGGDEFGVLLPEVADRQAVSNVAKRILKVLEEPVVVGGLALRVEGSIGIALYPEHGDGVDALIRTADVAMYVAKEARSGHEFYTSEAHKHDAGKLALIGELRRAMDQGELKLFYQPKVDLRTGTVKGVEALARWQHPERGLLSPDEFIPLAEHSSLLRPVTMYFLDTALRQASWWKARGYELSIAVNLSMHNLLDLQLPVELDRLVSSWRLAPGSLELEITESTIMADPRRAMTILTRLHEMGVKLAIDDFGTGYSSLAYLKQLPVSTLKIDKSFVMTMGDDDHNTTIVQSTIDLGHNLGLEVVAEGVENEQVFSKLGSLGCDLAQGFFLSRPLTPEKMTIWLEVFCEKTPVDVEAAEPPAAVSEDQLKEWVVG